jgi:hypothetical protein
MKDFHLLGRKCKDLVTGQEGVVTSISFDLYGCVQVLLTPPVNVEGKRGEVWWYDSKRMEVLAPTPIMEVPDFKEAPGGEALPLPPGA